jgi:hypothetical protein
MLEGPNGSSQYRTAIRFLKMGRSKIENQLDDSGADSSIRQHRTSSPHVKTYLFLSRPEEGIDRRSMYTEPHRMGNEAEASTVGQLGLYQKDQ